MNGKEYEKLIKEFENKADSITKKKRKDYASIDVLSNFKRMGNVMNNMHLVELFKTEPALAYALTMAVMKIDRIINLKKQGKTPSNESIEDSFMDLRNYTSLAYAIEKEGNEND